LPLIYYKPFKAAALYLNGRFPEMEEKDEDLIDFWHKFWYAERYYNAITQESFLHENDEYFKFKGFLTAKCFLYPICF
jgi:hypothetical protein